MSHMNNLIILEGPDCCGKTTLAKEIAQKHGYVYFHATASQKLFPALEDYHSSIIEFLDVNTRMGQKIILDRFWPSEVVYGLNLYRPQSGYNPSKLREAIKDMGGRYVFCFSAKAWKRYEAGHQDPAHSLSLSQYMDVYEKYTELFSDMKAAGEKCISYFLEDDGLIDLKRENYINGLLYANW